MCPNVSIRTFGHVLCSNSEKKCVQMCPFAPLDTSSNSGREMCPNVSNRILKTRLAVLKINVSRCVHSHLRTHLTMRRINVSTRVHSHFRTRLAAREKNMSTTCPFAPQDTFNYSTNENKVIYETTGMCPDVLFRTSGHISNFNSCKQ